jgi:hypothetical protein
LFVCVREGERERTRERDISTCTWCHLSYHSCSATNVPKTYLSFCNSNSKPQCTIIAVIIIEFNIRSFQIIIFLDSEVKLFIKNEELSKKYGYGSHVCPRVSNNWKLTRQYINNQHLVEVILEEWALKIRYLSYDKLYQE